MWAFAVGTGGDGHCMRFANHSRKGVSYLQQNVADGKSGCGRPPPPVCCPACHAMLPLRWSVLARTVVSRSPFPLGQTFNAGNHGHST